MANTLPMDPALSRLDRTYSGKGDTFIDRDSIIIIHVWQLSDKRQLGYVKITTGGLPSILHTLHSQDSSGTGEYAGLTLYTFR